MTVWAQVLDNLPVLSLATLTDWARSRTGAFEDPSAFEEVFAEFPASLQRRFVSEDHKMLLLRIQLADRGAASTLPVLASVRAALGNLDLTHLKIHEPTGLMAMSSQEGSRMIKRLSISFVFAVLLTGMLVAVWFGNWRYGIFAILPNIFPILMVGAFLYLVGWQIEMSSSIALTIAFGIAVDDTIHMLNHLRRDAPFGQPYDQAQARQVFGKVAPVLVTTTAILSFGTLGTQLSDVAAVNYFGALVIAIFILALIAVLVVLPAFWDVWRRREAVNSAA